MAIGELSETEEETSVLWNSLLKLAQANWEQSRANGEQSRANAEASRAMHLLIQRMPSKGAIDVAPDKLESWYAAECDAEAGIIIAEQVAKQAEGLLDPGTGEGLGEISSSFTKTAVGTKKRVPSVFELLAAGGHQREVLTKLEGMGPEAWQLGPS